jgi:biopolymer transport protein ExbB/TolQ
MKSIAIGVIALGVIIGGVLYFVPSTQTIVPERVKEVEKIVEVQTLDKRIKEAQEQAKADIEARAVEAYNALYDAEMTKVADSVKEEYIAEIEATISADSPY